MRRVVVLSCAAATVVAVAALRGASAPACDADNGGLTLPQGFCAAVIATDVGRARHLVVAPNGDVFVSTQTAGRGSGGGVVALRDTDNDGKLDTRETFGEGSATGIGLHDGYIY